MTRLAEHLRAEALENTDLAAPLWARRLVQDAPQSFHDTNLPGVILRSAATDDHTLITAFLENARLLSRDDLSDAIDRCYSTVADILADSPASNPVRFWNHICHIHEPMGGSIDRYMSFNVGRFRAFTRWFGGEQNFDRCIATASGVGCFGNDICIHVLATRTPGVAVANPRQVQPFHYSKRFGPRPPCFARATLVNLAAPTLLIGGTASIRGEESLHIGDLPRQLDETFVNLNALVAHGATFANLPANRTGSLADITDLRVYVVDPKTTDTILAAVKSAMPNACFIQLMNADLCRRELLVEIEGRAQFRTPTQPAK